VMLLQGFITSMRQEVTRRHIAQKWALDDMVILTQVTDFMEEKRIKQRPTEGVFITGMCVYVCACVLCVVFYTYDISVGGKTSCFL